MRQGNIGTNNKSSVDSNNPTGGGDRLISSSSYSLFDPVPLPLPPLAATLNGQTATSRQIQQQGTPISTPVGSFGSLGLAFGQPIANAPYFDHSLRLVATPTSPSPTSASPSASSNFPSPSYSDDMSGNAAANASRKRTRDFAAVPMTTDNNIVDANGNGIDNERKRKMSNVGESPINGEIAMSNEPLSTTSAAAAAANAAWSHNASNGNTNVNNTDSLFAMPFGATRKLGPAVPSTSSGSSSESKARSDDPVFAQLSHSSGRSNLSDLHHLRSISTLSTTTPYSVDGLRINPTPTPRAGINEDNEVDADVVITAATAINEAEMKYSDEGAANMVAPPTQTLIAAGLVPVSSADVDVAPPSMGSADLPFEFQKAASQDGTPYGARQLSSTSTNTGDNIPRSSPSRSLSSPTLSHQSSNQSTANATPVPSKHSISFTTFELNGRYKVLEYLGSGSYGHVHLAENDAGDKVAIKKIPAIFDNLVNAKRLLREIRILRQLNHPTVIGFRGLLLPDNLDTFDTIYVVFEYVQTDLERLLRSDQNFTTLHIQYFLYQIIRGLRYVHAQNVIHRDIKPANLLVNADCSLKICDFGLSRTTNDVYKAPVVAPVKPAAVSKLPDLKPQRFTRQMTKHVVTRWYRAPELILMANDYGPSNSYSAAIDMWACGCILAELLSMQKESHEQPDERAALFPGKTCFPLSAENVSGYSDRLDQLNVIFDVIGTPTAEEIAAVPSSKARHHLTQLPPKPKVPLGSKYAFADKRGVDLLEQLLAFDPAKRITAAAALVHPFMEEVRDRTEEKITLTQLVDPNYFDFEDKPLSRDVLRGLIAEQILLDHPEAAIRYRATHPPRPLPSSSSSSISRVPPGFEVRAASSSSAVPVTTRSATVGSVGNSISNMVMTDDGAAAATTVNTLDAPTITNGNGINDTNDDDDDDGYDDDEERTSEYDDQVHGAVARRKSARSRAPAKRAATRGRTSLTNTGSRIK